MEDLSLHILDIAQNCIDASATKIEIKIEINHRKNLLILEIKDNGKGMNEEILKIAKDPFGSTKGKKIGLGLPLLIQAAEETNGKVIINSEPNKGTKIKAIFSLNSIDVKPLGDMTSTLMVLIGTNPNIDFLYKYIVDNRKNILDTKELKKQLNGLPINSPAILSYIRKKLTEIHS